ncbi:MAG: polynucleotide adenylyltransferase PcnB [Lentisphaerae bacterium]|jgi:poly(A) polymerase|nr:polynucleotide adenylyltransferase PcnB [Lentisphaerota bacterium]MBT4819614.1 polynucleotide adenylyltransferase PcnB [Lentisphaerota bacterium]MBT5607284.1 polynucleotide adenylyltransferase PcnB [Lentisphaerota bacterium]MBT7058787.1 polynucleotide adenylyltransferase PcnB [Lentisphaerota bacterium]MBT7842403.1 polynucleotide adenylyltransferase PcnB [Lentisphaerota bacterium]
MPISDKIRPAVTEIIRALVSNGFEAYVVGGAVRDLLLDIEPKDYDLATSASPEEVRGVFGRRKARIIGRRFRLVHVHTSHDIYEISTFRREPTQEERSERIDDDGVMLWRDNQYGTLEQDAFRRDFTVNSLFFDPVGERSIIDLVGGMEDLKHKIVRSVGPPDTRIEEDPVRMLRALKLVAKYGFSLESDLEAVIRARASQISMAAAGRLLEELMKIVASPHAHATFEACHDYGLLEHFWPALGEEWTNGETGGLVRKLLTERDRRVAGGDYSTSKALALATIALPAIARGRGCADLEPLWEHEPGLERDMRGQVRSFFEPFPVSRYLTARMRDIMLMLPRFVAGKRKSKLVGHPEYKYGRELFSLVALAREWPDDMVAAWPEPPKRQPRGSERGGRRRPNRNRRRNRGKPPRKA